MRRIHVLAGAALAALTVASCAGPSDVESSEEPAQEAASAVEEAVACTEDDVTWPTQSSANRCEGRFRYDVHTQCSLTNHPECGCKTHKTCVVQNQPQTATFRATRYDLVICDFQEGKLRCDQDDVNAANAWCNQFKTQKHNEIEAQPNTSVSSSVPVLTAFGGFGDFHCDVTVNYSGPKTMQHESCGCQTYNNCQKPCGFSTHYSSPGMTRNEVLALGAINPDTWTRPTTPLFPAGGHPHLYCTTAEDIQADIPAQDNPATPHKDETPPDVPEGASKYVAKFARVRGALNNSSIVPASNTALRDIYVKKLKRIAESGEITAEQRNQLMALYKQYPEVNPACGPGDAGDAPACDADLAWRYHLCTRLTGDHVSPQRAAELFEPCMGELAERLAANAGAPACDAADHVDSMFALQQRLLKKQAGLLQLTPYSSASAWTGAAAGVLGRLHHRWYQRLGAVDQAGGPEPLWDEARLDDELAIALAEVWNAAQEAADLDLGRDTALSADDAQALAGALDDRRVAGLDLDRRLLEAAVRDTAVLVDQTGVNTTAAIIPDNNTAGVEVPLTMPDTGVIRGAIVSVDITHPRSGDIEVVLKRPSGVVPVLIYDKAGGDAPNLKATFPTHAFDGTASAGTWKLVVKDRPGGSTTGAGTVNSFRLTLVTDGTRRALAGKPLLDVLGQGVSPLVDRLESLNAFHDFGCAFAGCAASPPATRLSDLWGMLSVLDEPAALASRAAASPHQHLGWRGTFATLAGDDAVRAALEATATSDLGLPYAEARELPIEEWPAPARRFLAALATAQERSATYAATGSFDTASGQFLETAVHASQRQALQDHVTSLRQGLAQRNAEYEANVVSAVQSVIQNQSEEVNLTALRNRETQISDELDELQRRMAAHALSAASPVDHEAELVATLAEVEGAIDQTTYFDVGALNGGVPLELDAADAHYTGGSRAFADLSAHGPIPLDKDHLLSLHVAGAWAPDCALRNLELIADTGDGHAPAVTGALTGAEGYAVSWTGSDWVAESATHQTTSTTTSGWSFDACLDVNATGGAAGPGTPPGEKSHPLFGRIAAGLSAKGCYQYARTTSTADIRSTSHGTEGRTSITFSGGLRLSMMPFPDAPVGSLVAIEVDRASGLVRNHHLVRSGNTVIRAPHDSDVYLAVNDWSCPLADETNKLTVTGNVLVSAHASAKNLLGRMRYALRQVEAHLDPLAQRREILPGELAAIRSSAMLDVISAEATGCAAGDAACFPQVPFGQLPEPLQMLFSAFLDKEILRLERAVRIANLHREIERISKELAALRAEIEIAERRQALVTLLPSWHMRNVQDEYLRPQMLHLMRATNDTFLPLFRVWYPSHFEAARTAAAATAGDLTGVGLDSLLNAAVDDVVTLVDAALAHYETGATLQGAASTKTVIVSLGKRPDLGPCGIFEPCTSTYRTLDEGRTALVWSALQEGTDVALPLAPSDFYEDGFATAQLACNDELPVVLQAALVGLDRSFATSYPPYALNTQRMGRDQTYATDAGPQSYTVLGDGPLSFTMPLLFTASDAQVAEVFEARVPAGSAVIGLSPFTTLELRNVEGIWDVLMQYDVGELFLVMRVENVRASSGYMSWISTCPGL